MTYAHLHWRYLAMLMYPQNLSADWSYRSFDVVKSIGDWRNLISIVMYISALMIPLCTYQNRDVWHFGKLILFGMFIGIATFVPSGVFSLLPQLLQSVSCTFPALALSLSL